MKGGHGSLPQHGHWDQDQVNVGNDVEAQVRPDDGGRDGRIAIFARVRVDLPHVVKRTTAEEQVQLDDEPGHDDEAEAKEDALPVAVEVLGQSVVESAHGTLENPEQGRVCAPAGQLDLGTEYSALHCQSGGLNMMFGVCLSHLRSYSGSLGFSASRCAGVMELLARP